MQTKVFAQSLSNFTCKIVHDERRNPIDLGSQGQISRSTLAPCEGMPRFALSSLLLFLTIFIRYKTEIDTLLMRYTHVPFQVYNNFKRNEVKHLRSAH